MAYTSSNARDWLRGSLTALVTPFRADGGIDFETLERLVERQLGAGTDGLVPVGTTGEAATLSTDERAEIIAACVRVAGGRVPVIAGIGANDTAAGITLAARAAEAGANALLALTGYYNKPSQAGLVAHFTAVADATDLPLVLYNVPGRTASDMLPPTVGTLAGHPRIVGIKDATADMGRVTRHRRLAGEDFIQLSGDDASAVGYNAQGGVGCISVTANVAPDLCARMQAAMAQGDFAAARELADRLQPLNDALFADTSPGPAKYALSRLGLMEEHVRLPLVPASAAARAAIDEALAGLGLV
jgi:4-hydroxy-tetrahydrodipicolinate synthase